MLYHNYDNLDKLSDRDLVSETTRVTIRRWVAIAHVLVILVPLIVYVIMNWLEEDKPKRTFVATVISLPPPPAPAPLAPAPPKIEPKVVPPKKAKRKIPKKVTPKKVKPVVKKVVKPKQKILRPEDIFKPKEVVPPRTKPKQTFKFDKNKLREKLKSRKVAPKQQVNKAPTRAELSFYESVGSFLYQRWAPPSATELGGRRPKATVAVSINSMGRILSWSIAKPSGYRAVDDSIKSLMNSIQHLPVPPSGIRSFEIELQVD